MGDKERVTMDEWVTTAEAAKMLGRSGRRVLQLIEEGELEAKKLHPRMWMIKRESIDEYRASQ